MVVDGFLPDRIMPELDGHPVILKRWFIQNCAHFPFSIRPVSPNNFRGSDCMMEIKQIYDRTYEKFS